jgi:hypothetical protein
MWKVGRLWYNVADMFRHRALQVCAEYEVNRGIRHNVLQVGIPGAEAMLCSTLRTPKELLDSLASTVAFCMSDLSGISNPRREASSKGPWF